MEYNFLQDSIRVEHILYRSTDNYQNYLVKYNYYLRSVAETLVTNVFL